MMFCPDCDGRGYVNPSYGEWCPLCKGRGTVDHLLSEKEKQMNFDEYQKAAMRTARTCDNSDHCLAVLGLGIAGEAGEVADLIKKIVGHGHERDLDKLVKEIGDVLWYVAVLSYEIGMPMSAIAERNIEKLKARYPEGFSSERSINREGEQ